MRAEGTKRKRPRFLGAGWIELELSAVTTSSSSEQPFSLRALSFWLRSSSIDSPLHQVARFMMTARLCPLYKVVCVQSQEKNESRGLTQASAVSVRNDKTNLDRIVLLSATNVHRVLMSLLVRLNELLCVAASCVGHHSFRWHSAHVRS